MSNFSNFLHSNSHKLVVFCGQSLNSSLGFYVVNTRGKCNYITILPKKYCEIVALKVTEKKEITEVHDSDIPAGFYTFFLQELR